MTECMSAINVQIISIVVIFVNGTETSAQETSYEP